MKAKSINLKKPEKRTRKCTEGKNFKIYSTFENRREIDI
jgi:hypothetical protein